MNREQKKVVAWTLLWIGFIIATTLVPSYEHLPVWFAALIVGSEVVAYAVSLVFFVLKEF